MLRDCRINWDANATLKDMKMPTRGFAWVGDPLPAATVVGAIRTFRKLSPEEQRRAEMAVDPGVIGGSPETLFGYDALSVIASRDDVPEE